MRSPIIAANWKMHKDIGEALRFADEFVPQIQDLEGLEVVIAAPFTALAPLKEVLAGSRVELAAQNVHPEPQGAFTGEISVSMLVDVGCRYVIVGHSERRRLFGESNELIARKALAVLGADLRPIICVGETLEQREAEQTCEVVGTQLDRCLEGIDPRKAEEIVLAYEPVWAIGTGRTATPEQAQQVHAFIRERLAKHFADSASRVRIQYGGSVKPENIFSLMAQPDIDGALVGGASLDPASFFAIIRFERSAEEPAK